VPALRAVRVAPGALVTTTRRDCGCPVHRGRTVVDEELHAAFHALVVEQGGPAGEVRTATTRAALGNTRRTSP